jgi:hypothetical protein
LSSCGQNKREEFKEFKEFNRGATREEPESRSQEIGHVSTAG